MAAPLPNVEQLVTAHLDLARKAAAMVYPRVKAHCEFDDLEAMARVGLVEAAQRFSPAKGASYRTFAWYRAYGALMDGLRRQTKLPRRTWAQLQTLRAAAEYLEHQSQRSNPAPAANSRSADATSAFESLHKIQQSIDAIKTMYMTSIDANAMDTIADSAPLAHETIAQQQRDSSITKAIERLPSKERALMTLHYYHGKSLTEAGAQLGLSRSWSSRLHAQAIDRLRKQSKSELLDDS